MGRLHCAYRVLIAIDGIDLAGAKPDLRPAFLPEAFAAFGEEIRSAPEWFVHAVVLADPPPGRRGGGAVGGPSDPGRGADWLKVAH